MSISEFHKAEIERQIDADALLLAAEIQRLRRGTKAGIVHRLAAEAGRATRRRVVASPLPLAASAASLGWLAWSAASARENRAGLGTLGIAAAAIAGLIISRKRGT